MRTAIAEARSAIGLPDPASVPGQEPLLAETGRRRSRGDRRRRCRRPGRDRPRALAGGDRRPGRRPPRGRDRPPRRRRDEDRGRRAGLLPRRRAAEPRRASTPATTCSSVRRPCGRRGVRASGRSLGRVRGPVPRARAEAVPEDPRPPLPVDLALPASYVDYALYRDLARLGPCGTGNPEPLVAVLGLTVQRVRAANGGHTQLVLRRDRDVLDGIAFGRADLATGLTEGDRVDVVARLASRTFGGLETLQLEVRDVAPSGSHPRAAAVLARAAGRSRCRAGRPRPRRRRTRRRRMTRSTRPTGPPGRPARAADRVGRAVGNAARGRPVDRRPAGDRVRHPVAGQREPAVRLRRPGRDPGPARRRPRAVRTRPPRRTSWSCPRRRRGSRCRARWSTPRTGTSGSRRTATATQVTNGGNDSMPSFAPDGSSISSCGRAPWTATGQVNGVDQASTRWTCPA